jgi:hypothetical protein
MMRKSLPLLLILAMLLLGCADDSGPTPPLPSAHEDLQANQLFRRDARWVGGDGAYSTSLGGDHTLWLFGDSLVARDASRNRSNAWFVRNSLAIQTGRDPRSAAMQFFWGESDGHPGSFFAERSGRWFWPGGATLVAGKLIVFGQWLAKPGSGQWGFQATGSAAFLINNPADPPTAWLPQDLSVPDVGGYIFGTAVTQRDGMVYIYGSKSDFHDYTVLRVAAAALGSGSFDGAQCFASGTWRAIGHFALPAEPIFGLGAPESSVHFDGTRKRWFMLQSEGFGATTLAMRAADHAEGPWSAPRSFFRPAESFVEGAFVYAGKGHPELAGADLWVTYVPSAFEDPPAWDNPDGYYPHFVAVTF